MWRLIALLGLGLTTLTSHPTYAAESLQETTKVLTNASVIAFAASADLTRTRQFYAGVLGLAVVEEDSMVLVLDAGGTQLRISRSTSQASHHTRCLAGVFRTSPTR